MPTTDAEMTLLNRILEEVRALASKLDAIDVKHNALDNRVTRLEEDRTARDRTAQTRITVVCAFGALAIMAIVALTNAVLTNGARIETINSYGTAYGRGKEDVFNKRFESIEHPDRGSKAP